MATIGGSAARPWAVWRRSGRSAWQQPKWKWTKAPARCKLHRYISIADVGKAIHPQQCEAQEEGGVMMGIGHTFFEEMIYQDGQLLNPGLLDYRIPNMEDLPTDLRSILVENTDGPGPHGSKGIGESGLMPTAPAIANAIARAIGVRLTALPLTPERVWQAMRAARDVLPLCETEA